MRMMMMITMEKIKNIISGRSGLRKNYDFFGGFLLLGRGMLSINEVSVLPLQFPFTTSMHAPIVCKAWVFEMNSLTLGLS